MEKKQVQIIPMRRHLLHGRAPQGKTRPTLTTGRSEARGPHPFPLPERRMEEAGTSGLPE
jgi:hypothetical protein